MKLGITRLDFLHGCAASLAITAVSPGWAADAIAELSPHPAERPKPTLLNLEFSIVEQFRPFDLLPEKFIQVHEQFREATLRRLTRMGLPSDGDPAQVTLSPGACA
jgi:hypothetical protein